MRKYVDLHIHSCLSPCADDDMTPYNICAMAQLKQLDAIAITDHNSTLNLPSAKAAADFFQLELIPGIEITTKEEVHVLGYFDSIDKAMAFGEVIQNALPKMKNNPLYFGKQLIYNEQHEQIKEEEGLLMGAADISLQEVVKLIETYEGIYVPAHINRGGYGILQTFGFLPKNIFFPIVEVDPHLTISPKVIHQKKVLYNSDAHQLGNILERIFYLEMETWQNRKVIEFLKRDFKKN